MSIFEDLYADYYDVFYAHKPYKEEVEAISALFSLAHGPVQTLMSLGCGTLSHELLLAERGKTIFGIDQSPRMVALAKEKISQQGLEDKITITTGDMKDFTVPQKMDAAAAFFNVVSYCASVEELEQVFKSVAKALRPGGVFIFDCWYGDAVRNDPPKDRWQIFSKLERELIRLTKANHQPDRNQIRLNIELIELDQTSVTRRVKETHEVRYWDLSEIEQAAKKVSMKLVHTGGFPDIASPLSIEKWPMIVVARLETM